MIEALAEKGRTSVFFNAVDGAEGQERYVEAGTPTIPALIIDGDAYGFQHPAQIAMLLDLDVGDVSRSTGVAWSISDILDRWSEVISDIPFEAMLTPTLSRGRTIRNLTVNVGRPIRFLPDAWKSREFWWYTDEADLQEEMVLRSREDVQAFLGRVQNTFNGFLLDHGEELSERDPDLGGNRGDLPYSMLLVTQRFHIAFHYRQIVDHLASEGVATKPMLPAALVREIGLPENLY